MTNAESATKGRAAGTFVLSVVWVFAMLLVVTVLVHVSPGPHGPVWLACMRLVFGFAGLYWIAVRRVKNVRPLSALGFVRRESQWTELGLGIAVGWATAVLLVLPALLTGNLHTLLAPDREHTSQTLESLTLEVLLALAVPLVLNGLVFRSLVLATSGTVAAFIVALFSGAMVLFTPGHDVGMALFAAAASLMFSNAALRTRALWMPVGMMAGWGIAMNVAFGIGSFYWPTTSGVVTSYVTGERWLTGNAWGPEASMWALAVAVLGVIAVFRVTRGFAWHYAYDPIIAAGYPMDIAAPREHQKMEAEIARQPLPLVQIQTAGPAPTE